jgi:amino acid adenylation domain-containing protein
MQQGNPSLPLSFRYSRGVVEMFSERARQMPDSVALHDDEGSWTFEGVASVSDGVAERLAANGVSGSAVGIYSSRHAALVPALLGIWKAGAAAVILDSSYPPARLASQAAAAGLQGLICLEAAGPIPNAFETLPVKLRLTMPALEAAAFADFARSRIGAALAASAAEDTAYILFTSGTTGQPKAIATPHSALPHFLDWYSKTFRPTPADRFSMLSGLSHDPLMRDVFVPLTTGAALHIPKPDLLKLPRMLLQWLRAKQITYSHLTPSMGRLLTRVVQAGGQPLPDLRYAVFGGEPLRYSDAREFRMTAPNATIVNCYGASETPQIMAFHLIGPADEIGPDGLAPVGEAIDDVQILILDEKRNPVPGDREGEIAIRTRYLSKGYLDSPAMTAERFIRNPFAAGSDPDDRIYLTGDRGRRIAHSGIVYSGRSDSQVKIRGFRVELEEVEIALKNCPAVIDAAAAMDPEQADPQLYAFVQTHPGFDRSECRKRLAATLPQYMAPADIFEVADFPLTPNGKVDRRRLVAGRK